MAATAKVPQLKTLAAEICAKAGVTYRFTIEPQLGAERGLVNFDSPATKGSTLAVPLDNLCVEAIQQHIAEWAAAHGITLPTTQPHGECDMEQALRG